MTATLQDELLGTAADNASRVQEYFAARRTWTTTPDGVAALQVLHACLARTLADGLVPLLGHHRDAEARLEPELGTVPLPPGELDADRVQRFGVFIQQLGDWYLTLPAVEVSDRGRELLCRTARALAGAAAAAEQILAAGGNLVRAVTPPDPPAPSPPDPTPEEPPVPEDVPEFSPAAETLRDAPSRKVGDDLRLVLEDTERTPVLQTFQGTVELTYETQQAIGGFLDAAGIAFDSYQRNKFERKVLQWVEATPHGTVLVIRVGELRGAPEPFPTYAPKT